MYYGARWYNSTTGRFAQADTIIPQPGKPLAWDRFAYTLNNPVKYNDPSGHCWGAASGLRNVPGYDNICPNIDMAWTIITNPNSKVEERLLAASYAVIMVEAHAVVVVGTAVIAKENAPIIGEGICEYFGCDPTADPEGIDNHDIPNYLPSDPGSTGPYMAPDGFPEDPSVPPTDGFEWKGQPDSEPGSRQGNYYNKETDEYYRWDPEHPKHGTHWDYHDPKGDDYRVFPDKSMEKK